MATRLQNLATRPVHQKSLEIHQTGLYKTVTEPMLPHTINLPTFTATELALFQPIQAQFTHYILEGLTKQTQEKLS